MTDVVFENIFLEEVYQVPPKTTIIISTPWEKLEEEHRSFLSKILKSVKLSMESVRIIYQAQFDLTSLDEKPEKMIAFITPPKGLETYEVIQTSSTSVIFSEPLEILNMDDVAKRKLWASLKTLFPI